MTRSTDAADGRATPGPWHAQAERPRGSRQRGTLEQWWVYADDALAGERLPAMCTGPNANANARLIAAAPELYAALWALVDYRGSDPGAHGRRLVAAARAALAKVDA